MKRSAVGKYIFDRLTVDQIGTADEICGSITFSGDFPGFAGHFPGNPLVPGVCLIETVRVAFAKCRSCDAQVTKVKSCRFRAMVLPDMPLELKLKLKENAPGNFTVQTEISAADVSVMRAALEIAKEK